MPRNYTMYPCVNDALQRVRAQTFRGNTCGQFGEYSSATSEMREVASGFDVHDALQQAIKERESAGLSD